jgi:hypothetical protein
MTTLTKTFVRKPAVITGAGRDFAFWFAVLSPVLGIVVGFIALFLFYR